jgi:hypothetical protein
VPIEISQKPSRIVVDPRQYLHCLHGDAGVGKTTWCRQIPGHYFAQCEHGTKGLSVFGHNISCWQDMVDTFELLVKQKKTDWKDVREVRTLIIDTGERLFDYAGEHIAKTVSFVVGGKAAKYKRIDDVPYGKGFNATRALMMSRIRKFMSYGFGVVLVSHTKEKVIKWKGQELTVKRINFSPTTAQAIVDDCDAVGYCTIDEKIERDEALNIISVEQGRYIQWQKEFTITAKHRLANFAKRTALNNDPKKGPLGYEIYLQEFRARALELENTNFAITDKVKASAEPLEGFGDEPVAEITA